MKKFTAMLFTVLLGLSLLGCSDKGGFMDEKDILQLEKNPTGKIILSFENDINETQTIELNFELFYSKAPITVTNFVKLVNDKFYDQTFCMGGDTTEGSAYLNIDCYEENGDDKPMEQKEIDYNIKGEFSSNGWDKNDIEHKLGTMTMLSSSGNDSGSAYFQIILNDNSDSLDGSSAAFGSVTLETSFLGEYLKLGNLSYHNFKIISITVDTYGIDLGNPKIIEK
ncbi:MAG: peptidylprolyl isomerase [Clostridia bacterium]|nr:peptidylprolyl isomerase [Clostridia bacterium]